MIRVVFSKPLFIQIHTQALTKIIKFKKKKKKQNTTFSFI